MMHPKITLVALALMASVAFASAAAAGKVEVPLTFFVFRDDCYERFMALDIDPDCAKFTIAKVLGYCIILGSTILKVPQIMKILVARSAEGLSAMSIYIETINYFGTIGNSVRLGLPFSVYGESVFIQSQNLMIILLIWNYNKGIYMLEKLVFCSIAFGISFILFEGSLMTPQAWDMLALS